MGCEEKTLQAARVGVVTAQAGDNNGHRVAVEAVVSFRPCRIGAALVRFVCRDGGGAEFAQRDKFSARREPALAQANSVHKDGFICASKVLEDDFNAAAEVAVGVGDGGLDALDGAAAGAKGEHGQRAGDTDNGKGAERVWLFHGLNRLLPTG